MEHEGRELDSKRRALEMSGFGPEGTLSTVERWRWQIGQESSTLHISLPHLRSEGPGLLEARASQ